MVSGVVLVLVFAAVAAAGVFVAARLHRLSRPGVNPESPDA
jgi:hypothetical protein